MSTIRSVFLVCKYLAGYYPKAMKQRNPQTGQLEGRELKFVNGRAAVTPAEHEILKTDDKYGLEFGLAETFGKAAKPKMVEVIKSHSPADQIREQILADKTPKLPLQEGEIPETEDETIARLAREHDEVSGTRQKLATTERKPKREKRTAAVPV